MNEVLIFANLYISKPHNSSDSFSSNDNTFKQRNYLTYVHPNYEPEFFVLVFVIIDVRPTYGQFIRLSAY